jgi:hypothetical protein
MVSAAPRTPSQVRVPARSPAARAAGGRRRSTVAQVTGGHRRPGSTSRRLRACAPEGGPRGHRKAQPQARGPAGPTAAPAAEPALRSWPGGACRRTCPSGPAWRHRRPNRPFGAGEAGLLSNRFSGTGEAAAARRADPSGPAERRWLPHRPLGAGGAGRTAPTVLRNRRGGTGAASGVAYRRQDQPETRRGSASARPRPPGRERRHPRDRRGSGRARGTSVPRTRPPSRRGP